MSRGYDVQQFYFVVRNYDTRATVGVFETLDLAKEAVEKQQATQGFLVKWELVESTNYANHFDGTVMYSVTLFERNILLPSEPKLPK